MQLTRERLKVPDADFDQTLHICRKSKVIKNCEIIAALSQPFLRYGTTKFFTTPYHISQSDNKFGISTKSFTFESYSYA